MNIKGIVSIGIVVMGICPLIQNVQADTILENELACQAMLTVAETNSLFDDWKDASVIYNSEYSTDSLWLYDVYLDDQMDGYIVLDDMGELRLYSLSNKVDCALLDCMDLVKSNEPKRTPSFLASSSTRYNVLTGLNPQLQGSSNCIAAAASNVMWYYSQNGYSSVVGSDTFSTVKSKMSYCYSQNGGFANNNTPAAIANYLLMKSSSYQSNVIVKWNPSIYTLCSEIDSGRPVMLGFAAGSSFSPTVGHMTMGCGYQYLNNKWYVYVATGHNIGATFMEWDSSINDCMILIRLY